MGSALNAGTFLIAACDDALSDRRVVAWPLLIGGGVLAIAGLAAPRRRRTDPGSAATA